MLHVGLTKFDDRTWPSLRKTYEFYEGALSERFRLSRVDPRELGPASETLDAVVNFKGSAAWTIRGTISCPVLFGIHGGMIVDHAFINEHLPALRRCDALIVNCSSDIAIIERRFEGDRPRMVHLPLPVDAPPAEELARSACRRAIGIRDGDAVLGFVARFLPAKNLHGFLRMLSVLRARMRPRPVSAVVVGNYWLDYPILRYVSDAYPTYIKELIDDLGLANNIFYFPASLDRHELLQIYGAMDLLVHPTYGIDENFGYVPVEAMACGVPVIGSAYGGLKDTVIDGKTGHLMPTWVTRGGIRMDIEAGLARIAALIADPARRDAMARAARTHAAEAYSHEACARRLCEAVAASVDDVRADRPLAIMRRPERHATELRTPLLPAVPKGWEGFQDVVSDYVSHPRPAPHSGLWLSAAGPVRSDGARYRLDDPAWPMEGALTALEAGLLARAPYGRPHRISAEWPDPDVARALIEDGWLIASAPVAARPDPGA